MSTTNNNDLNTIDADAEQAAADRVARLMAAKTEHAALTAWSKSGSKGKRPATPNLDAINQQHQSGVKMTSRKSKSTNPRPPRGEITFMQNGKELAHNHLARLAANAKVSSEQLMADLAELGVTEPRTTTWAVEYQGRWIGGVLKGDKVPAELAVIRSKARTAVEPSEPVFTIVRTGKAKFSAFRNGVELGRPVRSAKAAQAEVELAGGPADVEVTDAREDAAA